MSDAHSYHLDCEYNTDEAPVEIRKWMKSYDIKGVPHIDIDNLVELPDVVVFTDVDTSLVLIKMHKEERTEYCKLYVSNQGSHNVILLEMWSMSNMHRFGYFEVAEYMDNNYGNTFVTNVDALLRLARVMRPRICKMFDEKQIVSDFLSDKIEFAST